MTLVLAFKNLFRNYRRTIAILLTIAIGSGALFSFEAFIKGVLGRYRENTIHSHYGYGQVHIKNYLEEEYLEPSKRWIKNWAELKDFLNKQPEVTHLFPRVNFSGLLKNGSSSVSGIGSGIVAEKEADFFHRLNLIEGELLTDQKNGIMLGLGLSKALGVQTGDELSLLSSSLDGTMSEVKLNVTGIFQTGSVDFDRKMFRIQLDKAQELLKTTDIELVSLGLKNLKDWDKIARLVDEKFTNLESASFAVLDKIHYQHSVDWLNAQFHVVQIIILTILLLGIFNTVSASILERKQEIGNLRANGDSILDVMRLIITEGCFLGIIGAAIGMIFSYCLLNFCFREGILMPPAPGSTNQFFATFSFEWKMALNTVILSSTASIFAAAFAGLRVAKMPIAKALSST